MQVPLAIVCFLLGICGYSIPHSSAHYEDDRSPDQLEQLSMISNRWRTTPSFAKR